MRVFINGMGRVGRIALRLLAQHPAIDIVGLNDLSDYEQILHLIKYDSNYGPFTDVDGSRTAETRIGRHTFRHFESRTLQGLPLRELDVDVVLECSGAFDSRAKVEPYLAAGARKVLISAPAKGADVTLVPGINDSAYDPATMDVISAASCTTNCAVPTIKALDDTFGIESGNLTTIHAYTNDQQILDKRHDKDWRRARNAATNIIPTSSGAGKAVAEILPHLAGKLHATALRVPVQTVSVIDCTLRTRDAVANMEAINAAFISRAAGPWSKFFQYTTDPIVSSDVRGSDKAAVIDGLSTSRIDDHLIYCLAWYDNEWGYTSQLIRALELMARAGAGASPIAAAQTA
ncbi:MAG: glyceraldehyde 3-phosphate dehydrogenase NAD-binding domain-containing protein [bacterium]